MMQPRRLPRSSSSSLVRLRTVLKSKDGQDDVDEDTQLTPGALPWLRTTPRARNSDVLCHWDYVDAPSHVTSLFVSNAHSVHAGLICTIDSGLGNPDTRSGRASKY